MHWIEQLFHLNPDGGNGMFEALIIALVVAVLVIAAVVYIRTGRRAPRG